jgi:SEC-C motif
VKPACGTPERLTMGLTLSQETSNRVSEVVLPPRLGRNEACHCGSGSKYKRCCRDRDEALRRQLRGAAVPAWIDDSPGKLHQFEKYVGNVFGLPGLFASLVDTRQAPKIPTFDVVNSLFHTAVLRIPSINALEGDGADFSFVGIERFDVVHVPELHCSLRSGSSYFSHGPCICHSVNASLKGSSFSFLSTRKPP